MHGAGPQSCIDGIHGLHQLRITPMIASVEEAALTLTMCDVGQHHTGLLVLVTIPPELSSNRQCRLDDHRSRAGGWNQSTGSTRMILSQVIAESIRVQIDRQLPSHGLFLAKFLGRSTGMRCDRFGHVLPTRHHATE